MTLLKPERIAVQVRRSGEAHDWRLASALLLIVAAFAPVLAAQAQLLWGRTHYQFFPLIPLGALALAYRGCRNLPRV